MAIGNVHRKYDEVWICGSGLCTCKVYVSLPCATCCFHVYCGCSFYGTNVLESGYLLIC